MTIKKINNNYYLYINTTNHDLVEIFLIDNEGKKKDSLNFSCKYQFEIKDKLLKSLQQILKKQKLKLENLQGIFVETQSVEMTSLRIGIATANSLAYALNIPIMGVKNFQPSPTIWRQIKQKNFSPVLPEYLKNPMLDKGFALLEVLLVAVIVAFLTITAFNYYENSFSFKEIDLTSDNKQTSENKKVSVSTIINKASNAGKQSDLSAIANAVRLYQTDNETLPSGITQDWQVIGTAQENCDLNCLDQIAKPTCLNLAPAIISYLGKMPKDKNGSEAITLYAIRKNENGQIEVTSCQERINVLR